jgi:peptidoglycan/xylan/chitin deacetylase (PgdA/CDA1 family)
MCVGDGLLSTLRSVKHAVLWTSALAVLGAGHAAAGDDTTPRPAPNTCWTADALKGRPEEKLVVKGDHRFDAPPHISELVPYSPIPAGLRGPIRRVALPPGKKLIALTFDLCEQVGEIAGYDGAIVDYLRANDIKATFFAGGKWMRSHALRTEQIMADPLFEVGNHSEAHRNLRLLTGTRLDDEILAPQRAYEALRGDLAASQCVREGVDAPWSPPMRMSLFRFPFGACNATSFAAVNDHGFLAIQWDLSTGDPSPQQSARAIADAMVKRARPGSIILAHANGRGFHTAEALPLAIPKLKAKGFEFVTVSELLAAGTPEIVQACFDSRPGDTDRYDHLLASRHPKPSP